jgi:hypothetical protein
MTTVFKKYPYNSKNVLNEFPEFVIDCWKPEIHYNTFLKFPSEDKPIAIKIDSITLIEIEDDDKVVIYCDYKTSFTITYSNIYTTIL